MSPNGRIIVAGDLAPSSVQDVFSAASGLAARVRDGLTLDETVSWSSAECRRFESGRILCRSADRRLRAEFDPPAERTGRTRFELDLRRLHIAGPFAPNVTVTITDDPPLAVGGIDRVGTLTECRVTTNGMICRDR